DCRGVERSQSDRRAGWPGDRMHPCGLRRADDSHLRDEPRPLCRVPGNPENSRGGRAHDFLRLVGGGLPRFFWYNAPPAELFMGDVGSLALGGAIGVVAVIIKQEILLLSVGGGFVLGALSVILRV